MPERAGSGPVEEFNDQWRIPAWQPAALVLLATVLLAVDIYGSLSLGPLLLTSLVALAALVGAGCALRYLLVADSDGIWVRRIGRERLVEWDDVADIDVVETRRNAVTVRISRHDKTYVEVPSSLLMPTRPTAMTNARKIVDGVAIHLAVRARERRDRS